MCVYREKWYNGDLALPAEHSLEVAISGHITVKRNNPRTRYSLLYIEEQCEVRGILDF